MPSTCLERHQLAMRRSRRAKQTRQRAENNYCITHLLEREESPRAISRFICKRDSSCIKEDRSASIQHCCFPSPAMLKLCLFYMSHSSPTFALTSIKSDKHKAMSCDARQHKTASKMNTYTFIKKRKVNTHPLHPLLLPFSPLMKMERLHWLRVNMCGRHL